MSPDVVVIGAGMAGLAACRWLRAEGFDVLVLEAYDDLGGQWHHEHPTSGVWPRMRTNTASFLTRFSDVEYPDRTPVFPRNDQVLAMLRSFADDHDLSGRIRFGARVDRLEQDPGDGYRVTWTEEEHEHVAVVPRVVVATGRYTHPETPPVPGWDEFSGRAEHAFDYPGPERYRGERVVVCGGSISALEVATDLAMGGAAEVHLAQRRQRYVMPKMVTGTPVESFVFTRALAQGLTTTPAEERHAATAERIRLLAGDPADYGAPAPHPDIELAGVTGSPHYLNLVAEGRISVHGWPLGVSGHTVRFADHRVEDVDAIVAATGFDLHLPFLSDEVRDVLEVGPKGYAAADFTFHPDLPGLALAGLWAQLGPYAVPLEQQARYIAYSWSGAAPAADDAELRTRVTTGVTQGHHRGYREQHEMALRFGRLAGVDPDDALLAGHDELQEVREVLPRVAMSADVFRLVGPHHDPGAAARVLRDARRFATPDVRRLLEGSCHPTPQPQEQTWPR